MNDYDLINNLLKDDSQQSLFKLKMIVDFTSFDITEINYNYRFNFVVCFKDSYEIVFQNKKKLWDIVYFPTYKRIEIFNLFLDSFKILHLYVYF